MSLSCSVPAPRCSRHRPHPVASEIIAAGFYSSPVQMRETNYFLRQNAPNVVCVRAPAGLRIPLPTPVYGLWLCWIFIRGLFTGNQSEGPARCSAVGPAVGQIRQGPQPCVTDRTSTTILAIPSAPPPDPFFFFFFCIFILRTNTEPASHTHIQASHIWSGYLSPGHIWQAPETLLTLTN